MGFRTAGYQTAFASDIEPTAAETFAANYPDLTFHLGDVRHLTPAKVRQLCGEGPVDVLVGGPPCQGFSTLGDQIQGDPRNALFEAFARVVRWIEPKCLLMENTSYLRSQYAGRYEQEIRAMLSSLGYRVFVETLNAADYGTPQIRKRVFFVGTRLEHAFVWPKRTHSDKPSDGLRPYVTVGETIMDLADVAATSNVPNHIPLNHSAKVLARYRLIPEGGRLPPPQHLPEDIRRRNFGNTYKRLHRARPALTMVPGNNAFPVHPTEDRSLTPREAARLQGFPDSYVFAGSRAEQCKLVGNAVPVPLARALAHAIREHLQGVVQADALHTRERSVQLSLASLDETTNVVCPRKPATPKRAAKAPTAVSFFTGAGGMLLGFSRAGYNVVGSYDKKSVVSRNLAINFPEIPHFHRDLGELTARELKRDLGKERVDVVFGGSPCQGFSIFGKRRFVNTRGHRPETDERNELTLKFVELALALTPKVILLENVKGILTTQRGKTTYIALVVRKLEAKGYNVQHQVVNCADYGVPQLRERFILVATAPGVSFEWPPVKYFAEPKPWQRPYVTVGDVISDLADPSTVDAAFSHQPMEHKELLVERYKLIPEGGRLPEADLPVNRPGFGGDSFS